MTIKNADSWGKHALYGINHPKMVALRHWFASRGGLRDEHKDMNHDMAKKDTTHIKCMLSIQIYLDLSRFIMIYPLNPLINLT